MRVAPGVTLLLVAAAWVPAPPAVAADQLLAGRSVAVREGGTVRVRAVPPRGARLELPTGGASDPTVAGAALRVLDVALVGAGDDTYALPAAGWRRRGEAAAPRAYRYRGAGTAEDPCRVVVLTRRRLKAVCRGPAVALRPPFAGDVAVILTTGAAGLRYCATFGGETLEARSGRERRRSAPVATRCGGCACGTPPPRWLALAAAVGVGSCGRLRGSDVDDPLVCGGLYFGGGSGSTPIPGIFPDFAQPLHFAVTDCVGERLTLAHTAAADVGSTRRCSGAGCAFGPPLPLPNPNSVPTSTCLYNLLAADARGAAACGTGKTDLEVALQTDVYLNGDLLPYRCAGGTNPGGRCHPDTAVADCPGGACAEDPGVQPCPVCNPATGVCNGGARNGLACVPDGEDMTGAPYPTSHDCPSSPLVRLGSLPIALALGTGTVTRTAVASGTQARVFCGYCRDAADTGLFAGPPPRPCGSDADCAPPFPTCEQAHPGAFRRATATEITEVGAAAGALADGLPHVATLASVFCVPPTYNGLIDTSGDLPGPGALGLVGTLRLVP
jgi:hypothetical protein